MVYLRAYSSRSIQAFPFFSHKPLRRHMTKKSANESAASPRYAIILRSLFSAELSARNHRVRNRTPRLHIRSILVSQAELAIERVC